jgi:lysozyme
MQPSKDAACLIKEFEGFRSKPYICPAGKNTIGYGHTMTAANFDNITEEYATKLLQHDLITFGNYINQKVKATLKQGQYDALCSLVYNWGCANFGRSAGLKFLNQGKLNLAEIEFFSKGRGVVNVRGKFFEGLYRRRQAELKLWRGCNVDN